MYETDGGFDSTEYQDAYNESKEAYDYEWYRIWVHRNRWI
jgi:hypothetical protein